MRIAEFGAKRNSCACFGGFWDLMELPGRYRSFVPAITRVFMDTIQLLQEFSYRTSRSGGKGGQNVNKVETKVEARFEVAASAALSDEEKERVLEKLANRISGEGFLSVTNQTERSQLANKEKAEQKLLQLIEKALVQVKKRKRVPIPPEVKAARLEGKRRRSEIKASRQKPGSMGRE